MQTAVASLDTYSTQLVTADYPTTEFIMKSIASALAKVTGTLECYTEKFNVVNYVTSECKAGTSKSYSTLYQETVSSKSTKCKSYYFSEVNTTGR